MTTTKIRLEAEHSDDIQTTIDAFTAAGFRVTGTTRAYVNRREDGYRVYAVLTVNAAKDETTRRIIAEDARQKAREYAAAGELGQAAYWSGYAVALEG